MKFRSSAQFNKWGRQIEPLECRIAPAFSSVFALSSLDGFRGFEIHGETAGDASGASIKSAGDVNGDGFGDIIIGAPYSDATATSAGAAYVVFGTPASFSSPLELSALNGANGFEIRGEAANDFFGRSVSGAGDVNGDGFDDIIIGADGADPNGSNSGASYVVFGQSTFGAFLNASALNGSNGFKIVGEGAGALSGRSVSSAGEINGDGFADVIIGASGDSAYGPNSGAAYIVFGSVTFGSVVQLGTSAVKIVGNTANDFAGASVSGAGDVNNDGFGDVILGAPGVDANGVDSGAGYIVFGNSGLSGSVFLNSLGSGSGVIINGAVAGSKTGAFVGMAQNLNSDSYTDVLIGTSYAPTSGIAGACYAVFGDENIPSPFQLSSLTGANGFKIQSGDSTENFGVSLSGAGDVNGDGFADIIASASSADTVGGIDSGAAYVVYGKSSAFGSVVNLSSLDGTNGFKINGTGAGDFAGVSVALVGDVNDDGIADILVGSENGPNGASSGKTAVIFGQPKTDIDVDFLSGNLAISDTPGARSFATLTIVRSGADVLITDASNILHAKFGAIQVDDHNVSVPFANLTGIIGIDVGDGNDSIELNFNGGALAPNAIGYIGGQGFDELKVTGSAVPYVNFLTSEVGEGVMSFPGTTLTYETVENVLETRTVDTVRYSVYNVDAHHEFSITASDQGDGSVFVTTDVGALVSFKNPLVGFEISGAEYADTITVASYAPVAGTSLTILGGNGDDSISIAPALSLTLFKIDGENDSDVISITGALAVRNLQLAAETIGSLPSITLGDAGAVINSSGGTVSIGNLTYLVSGSSESVSHGVVSVQGDVVLNGASLSLDTTNLLSTPSLDLLLIDNGGSQAVSGIFAGLAEGAGVSVGGRRYQITYVGGDGNDVLLKRGFGYGTILLGEQDGSDGFVVPGIGQADRLGVSASNIGDLNGDGFDDFAVGSEVVAPSPSSYNAGATYVIFGRSNESSFPSNVDISQLDGTDGFVIYGVADDRSASSIGSAGDVNGDGIADIIIGARASSDTLSSAYVVFGKSTFSPVLNLSTLDGATGFRVTGEGLGDAFGESVFGAGDINGDGLDDVIIGAPRFGSTDAGRAYVVFGRNTAFNSVILAGNLAGSEGLIIDGESADSRFGASVAGGADINGDGFDDILIGAPLFTDSTSVYGTYVGAVYVVFGKDKRSALPSQVDQLNGTNGFRILGKNALSFLGTSVAAAGDVNGDLIDDIVLGASGDDGSGGAISPGSAFVIFGKSKPWTPDFSLQTLNGKNGFEILGEDMGDAAGISVHGAGDFNGDGLSDIIVGASNSDTRGINAGAAYIVFGRRAGFAPQLELSTINGTNGFRFLGEPLNGNAGFHVSFAGDINSDGLDDILIGAPLLGDDGSHEGAVYAYFGRAGYHVVPTVASVGTSASFLDVDGDIINVVVTKGKVNADMFTFSPTGELLLVDLEAGGTLKPGTNITFTVKKNGGNGTLDIGAILGNGMNLGKITVTGDLGQIDITSLDPLKPAIKQLIVGSMGMMGTTNQIPGSVDPLVSDIVGSLTKLIVKRNFQFATLNVSGALGNITIGGDFIGNGSLDAVQLAALGRPISHVAGGNTLASSGLSAGSIGKLNIKQSLSNAAVKSGGNIGSANVGGSVNKGAIVAAGSIRIVNVFDSITSDDPNVPSVIAALGKLNPASAGAAVAINAFTVKKDVRNAEILIGYTSEFAATNPDVSIGKVTIKGNWAASSLAVGVADVTDDGFGLNDTLIPDAVTDTIIAKIASLVIAGTATGSIDGEDTFAITAQQIVKAKISGQKITLDKTQLDDVLVTGTDDFRLKEIGV